jgi:pilus assembly protein CpaB
MAVSRYSVVFVGALVVAGAATYMVFKSIEASRVSSRIATVGVVVAARDITEGTPIDRLALTMAEWPAPTVPPGTFGSIDSVAGRIARVPIFSGEPIVPGRLAPQGTGAGLEVLLSPGKRAYSVRVNDVSSIAGMIQPNSRVDILLTLNATEGIPGRSAKLFMHNMRVLAMGSATQRADDGRPIVTTVATLETTPEESERLAVAQTQGSIQLVLRGYGDPDSVVTKGATTADVVAALRDYTPPARVAPVRPRTSVTREQQALPRVTAQQQQQTQAAPAPVQLAPLPAPAKPESSSIRILRGSKAEDKKVPKDSIRRDTTSR